MGEIGYCIATKRNYEVIKGYRLYDVQDDVGQEDSKGYRRRCRDADAVPVSAMELKTEY